ncbi:MAG: hypothetical protein J6K91_05395 [Opitutales bacterium]|nr:hypothetical protein [Opitutales bacterium]
MKIFRNFAVIVLMEILEINGNKLYKFNVGASSYLMDPFHGARLINWNIMMADGTIRDVIYWPENERISGAGLPTVLGGMFIMFPFCGNSFIDGKAGFWKTPYDEKIRAIPQHGFALAGDFEEVFCSDTDIRLRYIPSEEAKEGYPFKYEFEVFYKFNELSFSCELILHNDDSVKIPWGAGVHPFFTIPWSSNTTRKDYRIIHDAKKGYYIQKDGSFVPADISKNCFDDAEMVNRLHGSLKTGVITFGNKSGEEDITIKINGGGTPEAGTTLVTWTKSEQEPYYCVEPWMSMPNSASNPIHYVAPNATKSFSVDICLY